MTGSRFGVALGWRLWVAAIALALALSGAAAGPTPDFDINNARNALERSRADAQEALRNSGRASADRFREIDEKMLDRARRAEGQRAEALETLSKQAGGVKIQQGSGGTQPSTGRGALGDIDTDSLNPSEFAKLRDAADKAGYKIKGEGDAFTIEGLDVTVHRKTAREMSYGSSENVGSSGHAAETARGSNAETAYGLGQKDPSLDVADNLKKAAHTLDSPPETISPAETQKLGKMTARNMDAIEKVTSSAGDPALRRQADMLRKGYSPETAGIVRENATAAERTADIADFQRTPATRWTASPARRARPTRR